MNDENDTERSGEETNLSELPVLNYYEERRRYPRVDLRTPVIISMRDGRELPARTRNVSAGGVQLRCDRQTSSILHPTGTHIKPRQGPSIMLRFDIPLRGKPRPFAAVGRLIYIAACRPNEFAFGVKFTRINTSGRALLAEFIMESLRPRE
ncbi:MAG: PilZ domain-containing protein [Gammaproteobacteria bacterium]|nr:PilZ domain-containing protein [Gammaproteobacteria bacterium]NIR83353.1 PilZ domain-containing protein [Gammaproteobacteria bacterium]NIR91153.1 PilZ domain-containing protein [Gammaproteobacteria bacterium]NIU04520.1 PilZ domain-containing protein [Gammaproteobacteria bacterium]NIW87156.1 hypothetical protein [Gammaproteobacteria bacterium]